MTYNFLTLKVNFKNGLIPLWLVNEFKEDLTELYNSIDDGFGLNPQPIKIFYYKKMDVKIKSQTLVIKVKYLNKLSIKDIHKIQSYVADTCSSWCVCGLTNSTSEYLNYTLTYKGEKNNE